MRRLLRAAALAVVALPLQVAAAQPSTVILVRHAEKAAAPANDPGLTPEGIQRATDLAAALAGARVTTVFTTHLLRTQLTAKPITDGLGKPPIVMQVAPPVAAHAQAVAAAVLARPAGEVVLVVGHSNTIPAIIAALGGPKLPDLCDPEYAWIFVLEYPAGGAPPRFIKANYGVPNPPNADACVRSMR